MKSQDCPRCWQHSLVSTGAFWTCATCAYAITGAALVVDLSMTVHKDRQTAGYSQDEKRVPS